MRRIMLLAFCCLALLHLAMASSQTRWVNPGFINEGLCCLHLESPLKWEELKPDVLNVTRESQTILYLPTAARFRQLRPLVFDLQVRFDTKKLFGSCTVDLWGYSESGVSSVSKLESPFGRIGSATFAANAKLGRIDVLTLGFKCISASTATSPCAQYHMGFMEMACKSTKDKVISPLIPLGWLVNDYYLNMKWDTWAQSHCLNWFANEDPIVRKAVTSVRCHPSFAHAMASALEYGFMETRLTKRWSKYSTFTSDSQQKMNVKPEQVCYLSIVDSETVSKKLHASPVAQCCYATPNMTFLFKEVEASDEFMLHGSGSFRSHPAGVEAFGASLYLPGQVPVLSHWYWDLLPYRYCCVWWSGGGCSDYYHKARPSPKLQPASMSYKMAYVLGNAIVKSFDGVTKSDAYLCSDVGDYWLLKSDKFSVQVRTDLITGNQPEIQKQKDPNRKRSESSFITGLAFRVSALPDLVIKLLVSDTNYKYNVYAVDTKRDKSVLIDRASSLRFFGYITMSDNNTDHGTDTLTITSFALKVNGQQVGLSAILPYYGQEFISVMVTAGAAGSGKTSGLLGDVASGEAAAVGDTAKAGRGNATSSGKQVTSTGGGSGLAYSDLCDRNRVASGENLFEAASKGGSAPSKRAATKLAVEGKTTSDAKDIACMSISYDPYCKAVKQSLDLIQSWAAKLGYSNANRGKFSTEFCASLPAVRGMRIIRMTDAKVGLKRDQVLHLACANPFKATKEETATCTGTNKLAYEFGSKGFMCKLPDATQKQDQLVAGDFKAKKGADVYQQHLEGDGKNKKVKTQNDASAAGRHEPKAALLLLAALVAICVTLSSQTFPSDWEKRSMNGTIAATH